MSTLAAAVLEQGLRLASSVLDLSSFYFFAEHYLHIGQCRALLISF